MNLYVYAFVDGPGRSMTIARHRLEILSVAGVGVAVERLDEPPAASEAALRTQHAIVERLQRRFDAVLPARFRSKSCGGLSACGAATCGRPCAGFAAASR